MAILEKKFGEAVPARKAELKGVSVPVLGGQEISALDEATREFCRRRVKYLSKAYRLRWMVDQATYRAGKLKDLGDSELVKLMEDMHRAIECPDDDVSYKEAGLLKHLAV